MLDAARASPTGRTLVERLTDIQRYCGGSRLIGTV